VRELSAELRKTVLAGPLLLNSVLISSITVPEDDVLITVLGDDAMGLRVERYSASA